MKAADTSKSKVNMAGYKAFLGLLPEARVRLLHVITILDNSPNILDVQDDLAHELRHAVSKDRLPLFVERLEGWWFNVVIKAMTDSQLSSIPVTAIENKMDELREGFSRNALPIDYADKAPSDAVVADLDTRPFVRQLRRIAIGQRRVELAIRDYYRASEQRSRWAREDLLVDGELENYERTLIEAWEPRFEATKDELQPGCPDEHKVQAGQKLFKWAETEADFPLRTVRQQFLTHGSYHILANRHIVGWHPEHHADAPSNEDEA